MDFAKIALFIYWFENYVCWNLDYLNMFVDMYMFNVQDLVIQEGSRVVGESSTAVRDAVASIITAEVAMSPPRPTVSPRKIVCEDRAIRVFLKK